MSFHFYFPTFYLSNYRQNPKCLIEGKNDLLYSTANRNHTCRRLYFVHFTCRERSVSCHLKVCLDTVYFLKIKNLLLKIPYQNNF